MKKIIIGLMLFSLIVVPAVSLAVGCNTYTTESACETGGCAWIDGSCAGLSADVDVLAVIDRITNWIFAFLLIAATVSIIIGGFMFLTAAGDSAKLGKARDLIIYAAVGIAVGLAAKGITSLVQTIVSA